MIHSFTRQHINANKLNVRVTESFSVQIGCYLLLARTIGLDSFKQSFKLLKLILGSSKEYALQNIYILLESSGVFSQLKKNHKYLILLEARVRIKAVQVVWSLTVKGKKIEGNLSQIIRTYISLFLFYKQQIKAYQTHITDN